MYAGRIVEEGPTRRVLSQPAMPYTKALLHSVPKLETAGTRSTRLESIPGSVPDPARLPPGCSYLPRCKFGDAKTCASIPQLSLVTADHHVRCHRWRSVQELGR
jgi:oligopeptide/dipeptide ABC transporter ATP-binding protein